MKSKYSNSWIASKQIRKQRKYRYNAPLHRKRKFLSAPLSKDLRKDHGMKNISVRKGDEVLIMRGTFKGKKGKILTLQLKKSRVSVDGINRSKKDGTKVEVWHNPSNLRITNLNREDNRRLKRRSSSIETKKVEKVEVKNEKEIKNVSEKNTNN